MIRCPDLHWPAVAGSLLVVMTVAGCVPANADPVDHASPTTSTATSTAGAKAPESPSHSATSGPSTTLVPSPGATATTRQPAPTPNPTPPIRPGTAVTTLATLTIKGRAPKTGYDRALFGQAWADVDRNGCDTRNDILRRDLTRYTLKSGTHGCLVLKGTLDDPYTGTRISFVRGPATSNAVQIDHVVALSDAWQKGAQRMSQTQRTAFANDPLNLLAVDGPTNLRKGDGDAATWLPPRKAGRCAYVARQIAVKHRYGLSVTAAERDAMVRVLTACPGQALPKAGVIALGGGREQAATTPTQPAPTTPKPSTSSGTDPRFGTCREANAAGYGPYRRGADPEYDWYQDRDHDGLACER
ncbi:GmrSD restriction endonuclease domain-containing protein [Pedococcus bigeumensis]|uniref:DUF1524 domain-containing protein n=1 Tax=Pedococcus bigeumensis TaxID=433644 RepID=A0A502CSN8_9MICO|nr:DUF1524 domain-containing protein [Pedococcus bigeumensis]TPG15898.1 DUF1524 domain-containing protein [Pedococcus bigeumensis]